MKNLILFVLTALLLNSCEFKYNMNGLTGLETKANGLSFEDCYLSVNDQRLNDNEVPLGETAICVFTGVDGFVQEDNMCYVGASMIVSDENGNELLNESDLFAHYEDEGLSPLDASVLSLSLSTGSPMIAGSTYNWTMRIWDKRGKGEITASCSVKLK